jgi:hypothetical protein
VQSLEKNPAMAKFNQNLLDKYQDQLTSLLQNPCSSGFTIPILISTPISSEYFSYIPPQKYRFYLREDPVHKYHDIFCSPYDRIHQVIREISFTFNLTPIHKYALFANNQPLIPSKFLKEYSNQKDTIEIISYKRGYNIYYPIIHIKRGNLTK